MLRVTKISIAIALAFGTGAALAQSVQRGDATVGGAGKAAQTVAQASTTAPLQVAQAGGAAAGASTGGAAAGGVGLGTTVVIVGAAVAAIAISTDNGSTVTH